MRKIIELSKKAEAEVEVTASALDAKMTVEQVREIAELNKAYKGFFVRSGITEKAWARMLDIDIWNHRKYFTFTTKVPAHILNKAGKAHRLMKSVKRRMKTK